jgi:hypothetical protein
MLPSCTDVPNHNRCNLHVVVLRVQQYLLVYCPFLPCISPFPCIFGCHAVGTCGCMLRAAGVGTRQAGRRCTGGRVTVAPPPDSIPAPCHRQESTRRRRASLTDSQSSRMRSWCSCGASAPPVQTAASEASSPLPAALAYTHVSASTTVSHHGLVPRCHPHITP